MLKIAFTGAGWIINVHAQAALTQADVELVAVVNKLSPHTTALTQKYNIKQTFDTVDQLLASGNVDALVVGSPNYLHAPQTIAALNAGVNVMVEKPMAMNAGEAYQMMDAARKSDMILMVAHCFRFDTEVLWLRDQAQHGRLGKIIRTKGYGVHALWGPSGWFTEARYAGGGALADVGVHALDTARFLLGDPQPVSVYARIGTYYKKQDVDDTGILIVNWDNGALSYIESGWWQPHTDGPLPATQLYGDKAFGQLFPTYIQDQTDRVDSGFIYPRVEQFQQSLYNDQMAYFINCVRNHIHPNPGGAEGWTNMKVIDAAYESGKTGNVVLVE